MNQLSKTVSTLWAKYYPEDHQLVFPKILLEHLTGSSEVLEIGAGSGTGDQRAFDLKGKTKFYAGIDLDERVLDNPNLNQAKLANANDIPFENNSFDLVFHTMVAEHLTDPASVLSETYRVLRPGGLTIFETVNKHYYPMLIASVTPHWFHSYYIRKFASGRTEEDVFPTVYKLNSRSSIKKHCSEAGFSKIEVIFYSIPPGYLRFNWLMFSLGVAYERIFEGRFQRLRGRIIVKAWK